MKYVVPSCCVSGLTLEWFILDGSFSSGHEPLDGLQDGSDWDTLT